MMNSSQIYTFLDLLIAFVSMLCMIHVFDSKLKVVYVTQRQDDIGTSVAYSEKNHAKFTQNYTITLIG